MKKQVAVSIILSASALVACSKAVDPEIEKAALAAAREWLALTDSGEYEQSWENASTYFRDAITLEDWKKALKAARTPFGPLVSREVTSTHYNTSLEGAPDGEYVVIEFKSAFENKKSATETVAPMLDRDSHWRVSGYFIK